jgi:hypothetical protein
LIKEFPRRTLLASVVYVGSPVSFYLVFRGTTFHNAYPAKSHLAEDAVIAVVPAFAGLAVLLAGWVKRRELRQVLSDNPVAVPLWAYATYTIFSALLGLGRGNALSYVAGDLLPLLELVVFYFLGLNLLRDAPALRRLTAWAAGSLVITGLIRLALAPRLEHGFGVTGVLVGGHYLPRLFLLQPYAFLLPVALAIAISGPSRRMRLAAAGAALLFAALVVVSFERALWVAAAIGVVPAVFKKLRARPTLVIAAALGIVVVGLGLMTVVYRAAGIHQNPIFAIVSRLAYSKAQLNAPADSLQGKRGDETRAIVRTYERDPSAWLFGKGLGATYVGPTGLRDVTYASGFKSKHYVFDSYLELLLRQGALGLGLALWLVVSLIVASVRIASRAALPVTRLAAAGLAAAIGSLIVIAAIEPILIAHPIALYEGLALGALANAQALHEF